MKWIIFVYVAISIIKLFTYVQSLLFATYIFILILSIRHQIYLLLVYFLKRKIPHLLRNRIEPYLQYVYYP